MLHPTMDSLYIPNNPQFGLQLEYYTTGPNGSPLTSLTVEDHHLGHQRTSVGHNTNDNQDHCHLVHHRSNIVQDSNEIIIDDEDHNNHNHLGHHRSNIDQNRINLDQNSDGISLEEQNHRNLEHHRIHLGPNSNGLSIEDQNHRNLGHHRINTNDFDQEDQDNRHLEQHRLNLVQNSDGLTIEDRNRININQNSISIDDNNHNIGHGDVCVDVSGGVCGGVGVGGYCWTAEDMGSFSLPTLDLDPLPSLFPFSPCSTNKSDCSVPPPPFSSTQQSHPTPICTLSLGQPQPKPTHDMASVLLSLKHAVVHPGAQQHSPQNAQYAQYSAQPQGYGVHPHQMLMSPTTYSTTSGLCGDQNGGMFGNSNGGCHQGVAPSAPTPMFPSMSVNVSMNMTMHGYPPTYPETLQHQVTCPQMQWSTSPQADTSCYGAPHHQLNPGYGSGATYSFTADFRAGMGSLDTSGSFKPVLSNGKNTTGCLGSGGVLGSSRPRRHSSPFHNIVTSAKVQSGALSSDDESQRPNLCKICGKTYARPSTLKTHLRTHSGEKPYRCGDCNKSFSQAANLTAHVRTHSGEKPFRCPICDRRFSQSSSVTTHMRTHSGERPYRCRMCKKAFSDSSTLTKHLRIHSGEKPYQCKLCLLRFSQSGNLNRHMRVHGSAAAAGPAGGFIMG